MLLFRQYAASGGLPASAFEVTAMPGNPYIATSSRGHYAQNIWIGAYVANRPRQAGLHWSAYCGVTEPEADIRERINESNTYPKPFVWPRPPTGSPAPSQPSCQRVNHDASQGDFHPSWPPVVHMAFPLACLCVHAIASRQLAVRPSAAILGVHSLPADAGRATALSQSERG